MGANSQTATVYTEAYIGSETLLNARDIHKQIFNRYREGEGLADFLYQTGKKKKTDNTTFHHFEDDFLINEVFVATNGVAAGAFPTSAGDEIVITISVASHQESGTKSPFKVGDMVLLNDIRGWVSAVDKITDDAHEYTLKLIDDTENWGAANAAAFNGYHVSWIGTAFADGTLQPDSVVRKPLRFEGYTQIHKTKYETHGSVAANRSEVEINGKPYYYYKGVDDSLTHHMVGLNYISYLGQQASGLTDDNAPDGAASITTTQGLEKSVIERGNNQGYASWGYAEFETMTKTLDTERAPSEYCNMMGTNIHLAHESALHTRNQNTGILYAMFDHKKGGKNISGTSGRAVDFGYYSYGMGGRTYHTKKEDALNYKPITGYTNSIYPDMAFFIPMTVYKDAKTSDNMYSILLRYKENDLENRFMTEWRRDREQTNKDAFEWNLSSEVGLQLAMVNQYVRAYKS